MRLIAFIEYCVIVAGAVAIVAGKGRGLPVALHALAFLLALRWAANILGWG